MLAASVLLTPPLALHPWQVAALALTSLSLLIPKEARLKFAHPEYRRALQVTTGPITGGNTWHDTFWGRSTCARCQGRGAHHLGQILTALRNLT